MKNTPIQNYFYEDEIISLIKNFDKIKNKYFIYFDIKSDKFIFKKISFKELNDSLEMKKFSKNILDLSDMIKKIIQRHFEIYRNMEAIYDIFSKVYDELYYDIIFKNIKVTKKVSKLLEIFATPLYKAEVNIQKKIMYKYFRKVGGKREV